MAGLHAGSNGPDRREQGQGRTVVGVSAGISLGRDLLGQRDMGGKFSLLSGDGPFVDQLAQEFIWSSSRETLAMILFGMQIVPSAPRWMPWTR
jgi:hypothetical protein